MRPGLTAKLALAVFVPTLAPLVTLPGGALFAAEPPCRICAGVLVDDPFVAATAVEAAPRLEKEAVFFVAWDAPLDGTASPAAAHRLAAA